jgi:hypothetical protein
MAIVVLRLDAAGDIKPIEKEGIIVSKQTFVIPPKNYPRPLEVLGEHAAMRASSEVGSQLKEGSRGSTSSRHCRPSESVPTKTFSKAIHRLKEDVRSWYELHRRNGATKVVVWAIYLELLLMLVLLVLLPFDTVQVGGRYRLIKPLNFTMSMAMYLATVVILLDYLRASMWWKKVIGWGVSILHFDRHHLHHHASSAWYDLTLQQQHALRLRRLLTDGHSGSSQWRLCPCPANLRYTGQVRCLAVISTRNRIRDFLFSCRIRHRGGGDGGARTECSGRCAWRSRAAGAQLEHHGGRFQGRALLGYPRITDFADSRLAHRSAERSAQTSEADSRCCRLRRVRLAHGICVHAGHERCAARENVRLQGSPGAAGRGLELLHRAGPDRPRSGQRLE